MDVIFSPQRGKRRGRPFSIEVGFFDTVQEIKEKIDKNQGIPVSLQTLIFKSQVLEDDRNIQDTELLQNSHVQLIIDPQYPSFTRRINICFRSPLPFPIVADHNVAVEVKSTDTIGFLKEVICKADPWILADSLSLHSNGSDQLQDNLIINTLESSIELKMIKKNVSSRAEINGYSTVISDASSSSANQLYKMMKICVKLPSLSPAILDHTVTVEVIPTITIGTLKEMIYTVNAQISPKSFTFHYPSNGSELKDNLTLNSLENSVIEIKRIKNFNSPAAAPPSSPSARKKWTLKVLPIGEIKKIPVEVHPGDVVGSLRKELKKLQKTMKLDMPSPYFFISGQNVMYEERTYRWNRVRDGDTIEIWPGFLSENLVKTKRSH